ncbi:hypothetical protein Mkiyose1088_35680 [Mycobacterium kiyosense]|nr:MULTISPECIES: nitrite reductase (NAD(P)H) small subunit [Mycobacterium]BDE17126.1 hypothetical protein MKCMC460_59860 [Mycobacterium sp. 20KCMC460]GLB92667.1 hypothetical protein SRL2020130_54840 [Mycobacterium kiyosense]GLC04820.1 hypothetical protein SRL2020400_54110 [Mycobacterium kiyosense]GLC10620.1 hypothetical protein SRL2020411_52660 [Mycobacterium kiyosense]GLC16583.1 hypothetical protein SRL2020448_51860 [Mycobacterium kiyosense]
MTVLVERARVVDPDAPGLDKGMPALLLPGRAVGVLLRRAAGGAVLAVRSNAGSGQNIDPFGGAGVISRGITGDRCGEPTVASPLPKQLFSVRDGRRLDDESLPLRVYDVRVRNGIVEVVRK